MDWADPEPSSWHADVLSEVVDVHRSGPNASPLVFINVSSNPGVKANAARQKGFINRWAVHNSSRYPPGVDILSASAIPSRSATPGDTFKETKLRSRRKHVIDTPLSPSLGGPVELVGAASKDPFESLPLKIDERTWQLLNYWLDARGWDPAREDYRHQVAKIRKKLCFPLIASSSVTLTAAITLIEQTVQPQTPRSTIVSRLSRALPELHKSLADLDHASGPEIVLSIVLLMNVAANLHDHESLRAHFSGLAALLSRQPALHTENYLTRRLLNSWAFSYVSAGGNFVLPDFLQFDAHRCTVKAEPAAGAGLRKLHQQGLLLDKFYHSLPDVFPLRTLLDLALQDQVSPAQAADLLRCIWTGSFGLAHALPECTNRIEKCCWYALTLNFLSEIDHHAGLAGLSGLIYSQLKRLDIDHTLTEAPEFVLWVALTAKSLLANREGVPWLMNIIAKSSVALNIKHYSEAKLICETFVWSTHVDRHVSLFYHEGASEKQSLQNHVSETEYADADLSGNLGSPASGPCTLCMRQDCPCPLTKGDDGELIDRMKHHLGMIWSTVPGFRKMCDQPWVDDKDDPDPSLPPPA